jgi:hypothetical protein
MAEEVFGPVLSLNVYNDREWPEILETIDAISPYGLTGAVLPKTGRPWPRSAAPSDSAQAISTSMISPPTPLSGSSPWWGKAQWDQRQGRLSS